MGKSHRSIKIVKWVKRAVGGLDALYRETTIAPGVKGTAYWHSYCLEGKKEALIACDLAEESWFPQPGERDKQGRHVRQKRLIAYGRRVIYGLPARGAAYVKIFYTEKEAEAIRAREAAEKAAAQFEKQPQERRAEEVPGLTIRRSDIATFEVGARALHDGIPVKITSEYGLHEVIDDAGEFVYDGVRFNFKLGYFVEDEGGEKGFVPAHKLRLCDGKISHLKLVTEFPQQGD